MPVYESKLSAQRRALVRIGLRQLAELATVAAFAEWQPPASPSPPTPLPLQSDEAPSSAGQRLMTVDILLIIFAHLDRRTLVQCSRVNRLCFEITGEMLYHSVEYGTEWLRMDRKVRHGRNIFAGLDVPAPPPYPWRSWLDPPETWPDPLPGHQPFYPSTIKLNLLRHVQHLTVFNHPPEECDTLSHPGLFPSLETITIYDLKLSPNHDYQPPLGWEQGLLRGLRPRHLRLAHIQDVASIWSLGNAWPRVIPHYPLEKATLQFLYASFRSLPPPFCIDSNRIQMVWSVSINEIDLVFSPHGLFAATLPRRPRGSATAGERIDFLYGVVADVLATCVAGGGDHVRVRAVGLIA